MSTQLEIDYIIASSGNFANALTVNSTGVSLLGHNHVSSDITNFNSSVSGLVSGIYQPLLTNPITGIGISGYVSRWNSTNSLTSGVIYDNNSNVGIGTTNPSGLLDVAGNVTFNTFTEKVISNTNSGSGITLNINDGTIHNITLTNNCVFTMPTLNAGKSFTLFLNTGSGNYAASFSGVLWNYSSAPTITTAANKVDILSFISDGTYWYGSYSQNYG